MKINKISISNTVKKFVEVEEKIDTFKINGIVFNPNENNSKELLEQFKSVTIGSGNDVYYLINSYEEYEALECIYEKYIKADFNECEFDGTFVDKYPIIVRFNKHIYERGDTVMNSIVYEKTDIKNLIDLIGG